MEAMVLSFPTNGLSAGMEPSSLILWNIVFNFDGCRKLVLFVFHQQEHVLDGRITLSPRHVGSTFVLAGPVFHVHAGDPVLLCFNEGQQ